MVGRAVVQRPRRLADAELGQQPLLDARHEVAHEPAALEPDLEVARLLQLLIQPAALESLGIGRELVVRAARLNRLERRFGAQHAALQCRMAALDARRVHVAGVAADERAAREHRLRQALGAAVVDGPRAVAEALGALQMGADGRVRLPALELLERAQPRVLVVQAHDEAERHLVVLEVVEEAAAEGLGVHRPAGGVHDEPGLRLRRVHLPQLLQADGVARGVAPVGELEAVDELAARGARARPRRTRCTCPATPCRAGTRRWGCRPCRRPGSRWPRRARAPARRTAPRRRGTRGRSRRRAPRPAAPAT